MTPGDLVVPSLSHTLRSPQSTVHTAPIPSISIPSLPRFLLSARGAVAAASRQLCARRAGCYGHEAAVPSQAAVAVRHGGNCGARPRAAAAIRAAQVAAARGSAAAAGFGARRSRCAYGGLAARRGASHLLCGQRASSAVRLQPAANEREKEKIQGRLAEAWSLLQVPWVPSSPNWACCSRKNSA